jgi:hypothetical protein
MGRRWQYYEEMKALGRDIRATPEYRLQGTRVGLSDLRRVYKDQGIRIDLWPFPLKKLRGAYFNDENGVSVMIAKGLPQDPRAFTMAHELKHHLADADRREIFCDWSNQNEMIEIGAEVFAAELLFPDELFVATLTEMDIAEGACSPEALVRLKNETRTTLSYAGLAKKAEFLGFADEGAFNGVRWKKLEREIYGEPVYSRRRGSRKSSPTAVR